jgi:hypothetical protein
MAHKTAYLWGPISSFSGPLTAFLLKKGWHVHVAVKSALNLFSLSPLDLPAAAQSSIEKALGGHEHFKTFSDRLKFVETLDAVKDVNYDAVIFCALPPNFDEARTPRAPWAVQELSAISKTLRGVTIFMVSSLWAGIAEDGVVPEELEFERRKPLNHWENVGQQYELKLLKELPNLETTWHLVRLPLISGDTKDGASLNFTGPLTLLRELAEQSPHPDEQFRVLRMNYNPDSIFWFLPVDSAVKLFWHLLEDENRPRICNLVSTQATLNREYAQYVAEALGYENVELSESPSYRLPAILRQMLKDNVNVKTRNLFEVTGRYQDIPASIGQSYFARSLAYGKSHNWGRVATSEKIQAKPLFSAGFARRYFEEFLPMNLNQQLLGEVTKGDTSVGFVIDGPQHLSWVLRGTDGQAMVERLDHGSNKPKVSLHFTSDTMMRLIQKKLSFERALITREVRVEGPLMEGLRVGGIFSRFLKDHPYSEDFEPGNGNN